MDIVKNGSYIKYLFRKSRFKFLYKHNYLLRVASKFAKKDVSFAHQELDKLISSLLPNPGFYVELGANDGISQSNTKYLEVYKGWKGVLVEPSPNLFFKLMKNRSKLNLFHQCACVSFEFTDTFMNLLYSNLRTIALDGTSDIDDRIGHAHLGESHLNSSEEMEIFQAPAKTLTCVLSESQAPHLMDFLSLDVEGAELEVLMGLDFKKYSFKLICVETRSFQTIDTYLQSNGYQYLRKLTSLDYLYKLQDFEIPRLEIILDSYTK